MLSVREPRDASDRTHPPSDRRLALVESLAGLRDLKAPWTALVAAGGRTSPFVSWEWALAWWLHYGQPHAGRRLAVVTAHEGHELRGLLPAYLGVEGLPAARLRSLYLLGWPHESSDGLDVLQPETRGTDWLPLLVAHARQQLSLDRMSFADLPEGSATLDGLRTLAARDGLPLAEWGTHGCPYLPISGGWADYLATRSRKFRKTLGQQTRRFFERADASLTLVESTSELPEALQEVFALHERRFSRKRTRTRFVRHRRGAFHDEVSRLLFERGALRLFRLRAAGRTVAALYGFEHANSLFYYQGGIDPDWERDGVGTVLTGQAIKYAFARKLATFEFLRGMEPYKLRWTDCVRHLVRADVGFTRRGRVAASLAWAIDRSRRWPRTGAPRD
jgi:CelD/BcsL family acetyltransferase involved in cellulose biosynthesis